MSPQAGFFADAAKGFHTALGEERARTREREAQQQQIEQSILLQLIQSDDEDIAAAAATGLLEGAKPRARSKGLRGFLDETQRSPVFEPILQLLRQGRQVSGVRPGAITEQEVPTTVEGAPPQAGLPGPLPPGAAAQPAQALTEGGPPGPVTMLPGIAGPIAVPGLAEPPPRSMNIIGGAVAPVPTFRSGVTAQAPAAPFVGQPPPQIGVADLGMPPSPTTTERRVALEPFTETMPRRVFDPAKRQADITYAQAHAQQQALYDQLKAIGLADDQIQMALLANALPAGYSRRIQQGPFVQIPGYPGLQPTVFNPAAPQTGGLPYTLPDGSPIPPDAVYMTGGMATAIGDPQQRLAATIAGQSPYLGADSQAAEAARRNAAEFQTAVEETRARRTAYARGIGSGLAARHDPLSPSELALFPNAQAGESLIDQIQQRRAVPIPLQRQTQIIATEEALERVRDLKDLAERVFSPGGLFSRLVEAGEFSMARMTQADPDFNAFVSQAEAFVPVLVASEEPGSRFSDADLEVRRARLPNTSLMPDTLEAAMTKLDTIEAQLQARQTGFERGAQVGTPPPIQEAPQETPDLSGLPRDPDTGKYYERLFSDGQTWTLDQQGQPVRVR